MLICKDSVDDKLGYYIYAPGQFLLKDTQKGGRVDLGYIGKDFSVTRFHFKIKTNVKEIELPLPKEISKEISKKTVTISPGEARIICKGFSH